MYRSARIQESIFHAGIHFQTPQLSSPLSPQYLKVPPTKKNPPRLETKIDWTPEFLRKTKSQHTVLPRTPNQHARCGGESPGRARGPKTLATKKAKWTVKERLTRGDAWPAARGFLLHTPSPWWIMIRRVWCEFEVGVQSDSARAVFSGADRSMGSRDLG